MTRSLKLHSLPKPKFETTFEDFIHNKVLSREELLPKVNKLRSEKKTIATVNGAFDLIHAGHCYFLYEAARQADILIVGLNTDESIKEYKDPQRPIIPLKHRAKMMASISFIDYVTWFEESTPIGWLESIQPDVHVNGSEYGVDCIEAPTVRKYGGRIHIVTLKPGLSTTSIVKKIQSL